MKFSARRLHFQGEPTSKGKIGCKSYPNTSSHVQKGEKYGNRDGSNKRKGGTHNKKPR